MKYFSSDVKRFMMLKIAHFDQNHEIYGYTEYVVNRFKIALLRPSERYADHCIMTVGNGDSAEFLVKASFEDLTGCPAWTETIAKEPSNLRLLPELPKTDPNPPKESA